VDRGVDIISMSFGFGIDVKIIHEAITDAEKKRSNQILFFAAANNSGENDSEMFPARFESVISVRGTNYGGDVVSLYDPSNWSYKGWDQFCTLAKDVPCGFYPKPMSGCSVATPIMAAIAAAIIALVERGGMKKKFRDDVRTRRGMLSVFGAMTQMQQHRAAGRLYVAPWQLFQDNRDPIYMIGNALSMIPPQD
jgi:hypothetical protein